jgi:putative ABC transport system permease protein
MPAGWCAGDRAAYVKALRFALRALGREAKSGELAVLFGALLVAVTALTAVGFFTSRIGQAIQQQAGEVLAADLRLESGRPVDPDQGYVREASQRGLALARTVSFPSVVFAGEASNLTSIIGVDRGYPLRGRLRVADVPYGAGRATTGIPGRGEAWADSRLLARLGVPVGGTLAVGALTVRVAHVLDYRPDQGSAFVDLAPTLLLHIDDVAATQLLQPGSRATWSLLFAGPTGAVEDFEGWLRAHKSASERLIDVGESSDQLKSAMERSGRFLNLAALVTLLLAAMAVAMAARRFAARHLDSVALLKCMGAAQRFVLQVTGLELLAVALGGALAGIACGWLAQAGLAWLVRDLVKGVLPPPTLAAAWLGLVTAVAILIGFALPPLLRLRNVPPARVLRHDLEPPPLRYGFTYVLAGAAILALLFGLVRDVRLVSYVAGGLVATGVVLYAAGWLLVLGTRGLRGGIGIAWRYGLANVARRGRESVVQIVAFGLGLTVLLLLAVVRNDLLDDWRRSLPRDAPNHFLVNIKPTEADDLKRFLVARGVTAPVLAPWVRARLIAVNGQPMSQRMPRTDRGRAFAEREQNLSWSRELPPDNRVVQGSWWQDPDPAVPLVSVATEFQEELGLALGDRLTFDLAGETLVATVANIRKVRWDGFRPNFFLVFAPGVLDTATGTLMTSVHLNAEQRPALAELVRRFPSVTVFDVETLLGQIRGVMDRASLAVQYVFAFTLLAGVVVLLAAIQSTRDERRYESAVLRTLGASRQTVLRGVAAEFVALGLLAGVLAASAASLAGWLLATRLFNLHYAFDPGVWLLGLGGGALLVGMAGTLATRSVVNTPPATTLRQE